MNGNLNRLSYNPSNIQRYSYRIFIHENVQYSCALIYSTYVSHIVMSIKKIFIHISTSPEYVKNV